MEIKLKLKDRDQSRLIKSYLNFKLHQLNNELRKPKLVSDDISLFQNQSNLLHKFLLIGQLLGK